MKDFILLLAFAMSLCSGSAEKVPLTMLSDEKYPLAKCLDGTQAGYYAQRATAPEDRNKWVIYLEGGGECDSEESCKYQTGGALGSSNYFANESDPSGWYIASDYCPYNPDLCTWNHVKDPYCTQDLHSGQVKTPSDETWGLYFAGHHVLEATLDELDKAPYFLGRATDIIVSGCSAGGIGVWMNVDYVANRYPDARVTAFTVAGHYFYATYYSGENATDPGGMADFRESAWPVTYDLYDAYVDETCKEHYEGLGLSPGACMISNNSFPFIESDAFVVQAMTDQVVLTGHDTWPETYMYEEPEQAFMKEWSENMTVALGPLMQPAAADVQSRPRNGVFAAACYTHGGFTHSYPLINGVNFYTAFANFYNNNATEDQYKLQDTCGVMCNPTCA